MKGSGFARQVTLANLEEFAPLLSAQSQDSANSLSQTRPHAPPPNPSVLKAEQLFDGDPFRIPIPFKRPHKPSASRKKAAATPTASSARGQLLWSKRLAASDVQRQPGHATGGLRLVQGELRGRIDQTTYFRQDLFGDFQWTLVRETPYVEETRIAFDISIEGQSLGVHRLVVSHKPSGESGQKNYTTILRWTGITDQIWEHNLTGKMLRLYAPSQNTSEPYFLDIS